MKKLVLAMACVLSLGLLASCKNGVQDVNVKNANDTEGALFVGTVELTATPVQSNTSTKAWEASTPANDAFAVGPQHATVAWATSSEKYDTNVKNFTLKFYVEYNGDTTSTSHNPSYVEKSVTFYSVGDKYYRASKVVTANGVTDSLATLKLSEGDPATGSFTLEDVGIADLGGTYNANVSKIVFKKAE